MALKNELEVEVKAIFKESWASRDGIVVPESEDLKLSNDAVLLEGTVLYADLSGSTKMVDTQKPDFSAEIYKSYLHCAARLIRAEGGSVTAFDGDRIMGVFIGNAKNTSAVRCGLKIHATVRNIINPAIKAQYASSSFQVRQVVGIDTSKLLVARAGVRGANDLVWVGRAANYAAKLTELDADYPTWITEGVYSNTHESVRITDRKAMWEQRSWTSMNSLTIYRSSWFWNP